MKLDGAKAHSGGEKTSGFRVLSPEICRKWGQGRRAVREWGEGKRVTRGRDKKSARRWN